MSSILQDEMHPLSSNQSKADIYLATTRDDQYAHSHALETKAPSESRKSWRNYIAKKGASIFFFLSLLCGVVIMALFKLPSNDNVDSSMLPSQRGEPRDGYDAEHSKKKDYKKCKAPKVTIYHSAGTGTFWPQQDTLYFKLRMVGAGGGGSFGPILELPPFSNINLTVLDFLGMDGGDTTFGAEGQRATCGGGERGGIVGFIDFSGETPLDIAMTNISFFGGTGGQAFLDPDFLGNDDDDDDDYVAGAGLTASGNGGSQGTIFEAALGGASILGGAAQAGPSFIKCFDAFKNFSAAFECDTERPPISTTGSGGVGIGFPEFLALVFDDDVFPAVMGGGGGSGSSLEAYVSCPCSPSGYPWVVGEGGLPPKAALLNDMFESLGAPEELWRRLPEDFDIAGRGGDGVLEIVEYFC